MEVGRVKRKMRKRWIVYVVLWSPGLPRVRTWWRSLQAAIPGRKLTQFAVGRSC